MGQEEKMIIKWLPYTNIKTEKKVWKIQDSGEEQRREEDTYITYANASETGGRWDPSAADRDMRVTWHQ